jgi:hypothetical protein
MKIRRYLLNLRFNRFGYIPMSGQFGGIKIRDFGFAAKGDMNYCYIKYDGGHTELVRYDDKSKKWVNLCFSYNGGAAA